MNVTKPAARTLVALALTVYALGAPQHAKASTNQSTVAQLSVATGSMFVYVSLSSAPNGYASCAANQRYVIDLTTEGGRASYATALAAKLSGQQIGIIGSGTCTLLPNDAEGIDNLFTAW